jgi:hypothetical protein
MSQPDLASVILLAYERLHDANQNSEAFPTVSGNCVKVFRCLATKASEKRPMTAKELALSINVSIDNSAGTYASQCAALLAHYCPGVTIARRKVDGKSWAYWIEVGDAPTTAFQMIAAAAAAERAAYTHAAA